jgi:hypothetical protein
MRFLPMVKLSASEEKRRGVLLRRDMSSESTIQLLYYSRCVE